MNRAAFTENGYSKGMFYNTYCNARVTLSDGRVYVFGGHDMQSNNGIYKVNIFDPNTEAWVPRSEPCTRSNWTRDPFGQDLFSADPLAPHYTECDPRDQQSTQPSDPSDQKYARWYRRPFRCRTIGCSSSADSIRTTPFLPIRIASRRGS